ncbi:efflux RND transporter periplasmic adaptor subunit [Bosea sp. UNC402CLCol]|uniref:efflux RND transporter periplasmic adaptor subunit n=1 Tax=Bosea sp. UNC402CLCol TaxID=1510531 RepID=UPI00056EB790|nr:efflux RND transporter periplasmic adaptor subunit [Bosea sp. UNC402CLCol]
MRRALVLLSTAAVVCALAGCNAEGDATKAKTVPRPVLSVVVKPQEDQDVGFAGTIQPRFQTDRGFRVLGRLISRQVDIGDVVAPGQALAQIDPQLLDLTVRGSEADLAKAQAQLANASAAEARISTLFAKQIANQADLDTAKQSLEAASAGVKQAQASLDKAREQRGYAALTADEAGVVTSVNAEVGQMVTAGQKVMTIARTDIREAVVDIPDATARSLRQGEPFAIRLQADPSVTATGKLREIGPQADAATRTRRVKITLDQSVDAFRLGATVTVLPTMPAAAQAVFDIPAAALLERDGKTFVWLLDPGTGTVRSFAVEVAERINGKARIVGQLTAGARIVVAGVNSLSEGQSVKFDEGAGR